MVVRFFRVTITGTNFTKLGVIKTWLEGQVEQNDLNTSLGTGTVYLTEDERNPGNYTLTCELYIKLTTNINKYLDKIKNYSNILDKSGITDISVIQYDGCTHDLTPSEFRPCTPDTRYSWTS